MGTSFLQTGRVCVDCDGARARECIGAEKLNVELLAHCVDAPCRHARTLL